MPKRDDRWKAGVLDAASVAEMYNSSTTHPYRLDDCIAGKLNVRQGKPRKNTKKLQDPKEAWMHGAAVALAELHRLLIGGNDSAGVCEVARNIGLTIRVAKASGTSSFDWRELQKAGVPE